MKKPLKILSAVITGAILCLPLFAQEEGSSGAGSSSPEAAAQGEGTKQVKPAPKTRAKKPAAKKKAVRKKREEPSEYKFRSDVQTPAYKFNKRAEPILKKDKKKKTSKTTGAGPDSKPKPKLQPVKSIGEEDAPANPAGGAGLPPGMNIQGMGGK